jgi:predicted RNase H-like HicB family nuclease
MYIDFFGEEMTFKGTIKIEQEEEWFVATCLENNIASQGKTIDEAMANLREAIALYYEDEEKKEELNFFQSDQVYITTLEMSL